MDRDRLNIVGAALADPSRAAMLSALGSGRMYTAGELARWVGVAASTATGHLAHLTDAGLVRVEPSGRFRYFQIASEDVADLLERIGEIELPATDAPPRPAPNTALTRARSCYDHIAGDLGVQLYESLRNTGKLEPGDGGVDVTPSGTEAFRDLGIDIESLRIGRRQVTRACLDWTERRHHLGGSLGAALMSEMLDRRWIRPGRDRRVLDVTRAGVEALDDRFGIVWR